jgi:hypothetical protein
VANCNPANSSTGHHYRLTAGQIAYLAALGVPPALLEQWLAQMNSRRTFAGSANGRACTARYADLNGAIRIGARDSGAVSTRSRSVHGRSPAPLGDRLT